MSRWVRIQTDVFEHIVFAREPFTEREAWLWLISKAAWKATKHRIGQHIEDVPIGSVFLTLREMQAAWRWKSDKRVRSFLAMLENEEMIETKTDAGKTQISICNYSRYQDSERKEDASGTHVGRKPDALKTPEHQDTITEPIGSDLGVRKARANDLADFRAECADLDAERLDAVVKHRRAKGGQITGHAARLFRRDAEACGLSLAEAVDTCISRNWITVKPEYLRDRQRRSSPSTAPPGTGKRNYADVAADRWSNGNGPEGIFGSHGDVELVPARIGEPGPDDGDIRGGFEGRCLTSSH